MLELGLHGIREESLDNYSFTWCMIMSNINGVIPLGEKSGVAQYFCTDLNKK